MKAVIERCSFHEIPAAHQYADTDRIKGNVVIKYKVVPYSMHEAELTRKMASSASVKRIVGDYICMNRDLRIIIIGAGIVGSAIAYYLSK
ncbi:hypothetical protein [Paenibacillus sp. B1-33]|uniref:hypothetical protein n=1 Tax=unclassified Paenibacillus TaxID=185978 RepID=UPI003D2BA175